MRLFPTSAKHAIAYSALSLLGCVVLAANAQAEEQIYDLKGAVVARGTIVNVTRDGVTITTRAGDRTIPANEIQRVLYEEETGETRTVKTRISSGQLEQALDDLKKVNLAGIQRPELLHDMEYYRAYCLAKLSLAGNGNKNAAGSALFKFIQTRTTSYHLYAAAELMGDVSQAVGRFDTAAQYYGYVAKSPWPAEQMKGAVLTAGAYLASEDFAKAAAAYDAVLAKPQNDAESLRQKKFATLGKAYCAGMEGKTQIGIDAVNEVIGNAGSEDAALFGRAYNALGVCHMKAGNKKEAVRAFLHTSLLFNTDANVHAESLYHLAKLWDDLDESQRALKTRSLLKSRYATTAWANK